MTEESTSLKNLKKCLEKTIFPSTNAINTRKARIKPTKDVLDFIKTQDNLEWNTIGYSCDKNFNTLPVYDEYIKVNK